MLVHTKYFGEIDITEDKVVHFEKGLMGFEQYKDYTVLYDIEDDKKAVIYWLQSMEEPTLAFPVIDPFAVKSDYNPVVEDEWLLPLGEMTEDNVLLLLLMTVPSDVKKMTANLKAPLIVNMDTRKGCQLIVENADYEIKFSVYEAIERMKSEKGDE